MSLFLVLSSISFCTKSINLFIWDEICCYCHQNENARINTNNMNSITLIQQKHSYCTHLLLLLLLLLRFEMNDERSILCPTIRQKAPNFFRRSTGLLVAAKRVNDCGTLCHSVFFQHSPPKLMDFSPPTVRILALSYSVLSARSLME